ncbi:hypothetical protein KQ878_02305 [Mycoplasma zalophidermidis]|uniref:Lipoprotein n=1 Tax=Mycoplasma zalophidermidis TaxID=398174 RepID=A0ABS6DRS1_9MOLU|nr:hypothetical protein [Mycoplasma zalophidermidis]MBU4689783.1 hypothetical protein [Mycoplasma zalophidermidis]MBU4693705.1 hypothetical protein [Mycoplasma zalophidermidis]
MKKNRKFIIGSSIALSCATAGVVLTAVFANFNHAKKSATKLIASYSFILGSGFNEHNKLENYYASDFAYASYYDSRTSYSSSQFLFQPKLKNTSTADNHYWPYQLEIGYDYEKSPVEDYKQRQLNKLFILKNIKTGAPIDVLKQTHNIYYHSYANDLDGTLYLSVLLEDKNSDKAILDKSTSDSARIDKWKIKTFKITGFKKMDINSMSELTMNSTTQTSLLSGFSILESASLRELLNKGEYKNTLDNTEAQISKVSDLLDKNVLPSSKATDEKNIKENNEKVNKYLNISRTNYNNKLFEIDNSKPMWFTKTDNPDKLLLHYYVLRNIPSASESNLTKNTQIAVETEQTQVVYFNYYHLKNLAQNAVISGKEKVNLGEYSQEGSSALSFYRNSNYNANNSSGGYFDQLDLKFKEDLDFNTLPNHENLSDSEKSLNNYSLKFVTDNYYKPNAKNGTQSISDTPFVGKQEDDKIIFALGLSSDKISSSNGINTYYWPYELTGFKKMSK